ncbi:MAG: endonuclease/exonuclease/phosphatase family protein [Acidisphaera sp.]|nr:endonuclease/exonuclease/phosphatase family protein [Acidisphaera sp.]
MAPRRRRLRVATWNINSLRLRAPLLRRLIDGVSPDVICLQETKVADPLFPAKVPKSLGFPFVAFRGMKGYNGVAVFSRVPFEEQSDAPDWCSKGDCRHLAVRLDVPGEPVVLHDFYVPAGGDVPDPAANPKYRHKLDFVAEATGWFATTPPARSILVGDLNIAPLEHDVWSHRQLLKVVSHTPPETEGLTAWLATGFTDAVRRFVPAEHKHYTWWSYRNIDWRASDRGRRLDHVWVTHDLAPALVRQVTLKDARDWPQPSDHVPVCVELAL